MCRKSELKKNILRGPVISPPLLEFDLLTAYCRPLVYAINHLFKDNCTNKTLSH